MQETETLYTSEITFTPIHHPWSRPESVSSEDISPRKGNISLIATGNLSLRSSWMSLEIGSHSQTKALVLQLCMQGGCAWTKQRDLLVCQTHEESPCCHTDWATVSPTGLPSGESPQRHTSPSPSRTQSLGPLWFTGSAVHSGYHSIPHTDLRHLCILIFPNYT